GVTPPSPPEGREGGWGDAGGDPIDAGKLRDTSEPRRRYRGNRAGGALFLIRAAERLAAVDDQHRAGGVARGVAGEVERGANQVLGLAEAALRDGGQGALAQSRSLPEG